MKNKIVFIIVCIFSFSQYCIELSLGEVSGDTKNGATGKLSGQFITSKKKPLANGRLYIYNKSFGLPSTDTYVRVPDQLAELDKNGKFDLELSPGNYYISAINAPEGTPMGPPKDGEQIYFKMNTKKEIQSFAVLANRKTNIGVITTSLPYRREDNRKVRKDLTQIEGTVVDENGAPIEGAVILAHMRPGIEAMASYVSERTSKSGKFALIVNDGGTYYLRVRSDYHGGAPEVVEFVNFNDPKEQINVSLAKGQKLTGITVKAKRLQQKGPLSKQ